MAIYGNLIQYFKPSDPSRIQHRNRTDVLASLAASPAEVQKKTQRFIIFSPLANPADDNARILVRLGLGW